MSDYEEYELLGDEPRRILKSDKKKKKIILSIIGILAGIGIVIAVISSISKPNPKPKKGNFRQFLTDKEIHIDDFVPVIKNKTDGPITVDKSKDDGTKVNLFDYIWDVDDNKIEYFLYGNETINGLEDTITKEDKYCCESDYAITEDGGQFYDISCPLYYHIAIDETFYGRHANDQEHCDKNYKGDKLSTNSLLTLKNCGCDIDDIVKPACEGKTNCYLYPEYHQYPDCCRSKRKYLHLKYHCAKNKENQAPKFAIVMFANRINPNSLFEHSISEFYQYSKIHGYKLIFNSKKYDDGRDLYYTKLEVLIEAVIDGLKTKEYEWIFWADGDTAILNPNIKLESFIPEDNDIHFIGTRDQNSLNAGLFMIRVNSWTLNFLMRAMSYQYYNPDRRVSFSDQASLNNVLVQFKEERHYVVVPQAWFNDYFGHRKPGYFIIHFAGRKDKEEASRQARNEAYADKEWGKAKTNMQMRKEVVEYYRRPRENQLKFHFVET